MPDSHNRPQPIGFNIPKPFEQVPIEVWEDLDYRIALHDLECVDNFRAYRRSDDFLEAEYKWAARCGCCGIFEDSTRIHGEVWIIGCNYGH
jgi:hypothetical protein